MLQTVVECVLLQLFRVHVQELLELALPEQVSRITVSVSSRTLGSGAQISGVTWLNLEQQVLGLQNLAIVVIHLVLAL